MRTYNSISYFINIEIGSIFHKNIAYLIEDQISKIEIENSIGYRAPRIIVQFNDIDNKAGAFLHQTNCYLNLDISLGLSKTPIIAMKFLIDNVDVLSSTKEGATYEISAVCDIEDFLTHSVNYSTVVGGYADLPLEGDDHSQYFPFPEDPYDIINAVASDVGITIYNMKEDIDVKPSKLGDPIFFITHAGMTVNDVIDFCLCDFP